MNTIHHSHSKGQVLVIVSLMLIGLVAVLALVLDGGMLFSNRRSAQLAADAGALAGARAYCLTEHSSPGAATIAAVNAANQYVLLNNADLVGVNVETGSGDVTVDTAITYDTFFLGILGRAQMTATASATAGCTPPTNARNVLPVAWSCKKPVGEDENLEDYCTLELMDEGPLADDNVCTAGEDPIYIVVDSEKIEEELVCGDPTETPPEGVNYVDCDFDDDGEDDIAGIAGGNKSWLNLEGNEANPSDLDEWIEEGYDGIIKIHTWFAGFTGTNTNVYHAIADYLVGHDVIVPVFDQVCDEIPSGEDDNPCKDLWHEEDTVVPYSDNKDYFHIISFALFRITCVDDGGGSDCPAASTLDLESIYGNGVGAKTVEGCFVDGFDPGLGGGGGEADTGTFVVYLKR